MDSKPSEGNDRHSATLQQPICTAYPVPPPQYQPLGDANQTPVPPNIVYQPLGDANQKPVQQPMGYQPYLVVTQPPIQRNVLPMVRRRFQTILYIYNLYM